MGLIRPRHTLEFRKKIQLPTIFAHFIITLTFMALMAVRFSLRWSIKSFASYSGCVCVLVCLEIFLFYIRTSYYVAIIVYALILTVLAYIEDGKPTIVYILSFALTYLYSLVRSEQMPFHLAFNVLLQIEWFQQ